ncbi:hypothetical protein D9M69_636490 [compost metagenome]
MLARAWMAFLAPPVSGGPPMLTLSSWPPTWRRKQVTSIQSFSSRVSFQEEERPCLDRAGVTAFTTS